MSLELIRTQLTEARSVLDTFISNADTLDAILQASEHMVQAITQGHKIISCGNGGSMSDAMHFAEELTGKFRESRPSLPAMAISDPGYLSCVANDFGYDAVFSRFIEGMGQRGDVLLAISTSGQSPNVIRAAETARDKGMTVIGLTGKSGGKLAPLCDTEIRVPHNGYADRIQEVHIKVIHCFITLIEAGIDG